MPKNDQALVLVRGGGDLATGVALRLHRTGIKVVITELAQPLAVRRTVSFSEAVYEGSQTVEGVTARLVKEGEPAPESYQRVLETLGAGDIPVLVDPDVGILLSTRRQTQGIVFHFPVVIDARLLKRAPEPLPVPVPLHIGLGPGFHAGRDCHAVIETRRSHTLGRVYWVGMTQPDSGEPEGDPGRVLRAPFDGVMIAHAKIGDHVGEEQKIASVQVDAETGRKPDKQTSAPVYSPFAGVLRGLIRHGMHVTTGLKIGDVDPRDDSSACYLVSDKALAIGGGVLEAILSKEEIRRTLWK